MLELLARNGIAPQEAAMIGDRDLDINAARNANMQGILFGPEDLYSNFVVEQRVKSMDELRLLLLSH